MYMYIIIILLWQTVTIITNEGPCYNNEPKEKRLCEHEVKWKLKRTIRII